MTNKNDNHKNDSDKFKQYNEKIFTLAINYSTANSEGKEELIKFIRSNFFREDVNINNLINADLEIYTYIGASNTIYKKVCEIHMNKPINRHYTLTLGTDDSSIVYGYKTKDKSGIPDCNCKFNESNKK